MDVKIPGWVNWIILAVAIGFLINLCIWASKYSNKAEYFKMELKRSMDPRERAHWKRELSALRWSVLPFMNRRRYYQLYRFFHKHKDAT